MNRGLFVFVTVAVLLIFWLEWPQLKRKPLRDKIVVITILLLGWFMSWFDLPHVPGPTTVLQKIYKPFRVWLDK